MTNSRSSRAAKLHGLVMRMMPSNIASQLGVVPDLLGIEHPACLQMILQVSVPKFRLRVANLGR